jgi:DNA-binding MarR family transcriptional regulator
VDALVRKHLLRRGVSGTDARALRIEATPEGEKRYRRIRDDLLEESVAALSAFAPAIRRPMIDLVRRLGDELEGRALEQIEPSDLP